MLYFSEVVHVGKTDAIRFLAEAIPYYPMLAGGTLWDKQQMSSLRWLEAGVTADFGTVI